VRAREGYGPREPKGRRLPASRQDKDEQKDIVSLDLPEPEMAAARHETGSLGYENVADYLLALHRARVSETSQEDEDDNSDADGGEATVVE
jgi:hypothetical protein